MGLRWQEIADLSPIPELEPFYVERPPSERLCYEVILAASSALLRIKAPRRMGKTWLMSQVLNQAANHDYRTVAFNLREAVDANYTNLDQFLRFFCTNISSYQGLPNRVDEHWDTELGNEKVKCRTYFEKYLLASEHPLVLALDELDRVYPYPAIAEHFLGMLRTWNEWAANQNIWKRLRLIVVYKETYPYQLSHHQSPFNVGRLIELPEFTQEQVRELVQIYDLSWDEAQVGQLMDIVSGLPNLVHQAISHLKNHQNTTLEELLAKAHTFEGIYSEHLQGLLLNLKQQPELITAFRQVITVTSPVQLDWEQASKLHSMGLVSLQGNQIAPSCKLYRQFFPEQL